VATDVTRLDPPPVIETEGQRLNGAAPREPSPESAPELNGNGAYPRARAHAPAGEASMPAVSLSPSPALKAGERETMQASDCLPDSVSRENRAVGQALASFDSAIAPLEVRAGKPLRGPWRSKWEAKYAENPEGFCRVRDDVLERPQVQSVFAYFNRLLDDGDHLEEPLDEVAAAESVPRVQTRNPKPKGLVTAVCDWCKTEGPCRREVNEGIDRLSGERFRDEELLCVDCIRGDEEAAQEMTAQEMKRKHPEPVVCHSCGTGAGEHAADCEAIAEKRKQSLEAMREAVAGSEALRSPEPVSEHGAKP
jgi:hypothetical protein